jgi:predicted metal-dependent peptidase
MMWAEHLLPKGRRRDIQNMKRKRQLERRIILKRTLNKWGMRGEAGFLSFVISTGGWSL